MGCCFYPSQIWNWFQNRRYALRARGNKAPGKLNVSSMPRAVDPANQMRNVLQPLAVGPKPTHMSGNLPSMTPVPSGILGALYIYKFRSLFI